MKVTYQSQDRGSSGRSLCCCCYAVLESLGPPKKTQRQRSRHHLRRLAWHSSTVAVKPKNLVFRRQADQSARSLSPVRQGLGGPVILFVPPVFISSMPSSPQASPSWLSISHHQVCSQIKSTRSVKSTYFLPKIIETYPFHYVPLSKEDSPRQNFKMVCAKCQRLHKTVLATPEVKKKTEMYYGSPASSSSSTDKQKATLGQAGISKVSLDLKITETARSRLIFCRASSSPKQQRTHLPSTPAHV